MAPIAEAPAPAKGSLVNQLQAALKGGALRQYGIRVVDVRIKRLNFPEQNKQSVYARMRAERERIARQFPGRERQRAQSSSLTPPRPTQHSRGIARRTALPPPPHTLSRSRGRASVGQSVASHGDPARGACRSVSRAARRAGRGAWPRGAGSAR